MTRAPVQSSMLKSVGYEDGMLEAEFSNGLVYRYDGITKEQFDDLMAADSIGGHFNKHIRGGCTSCTRVEPEKKTQEPAAAEAVG